MLEWTLMTLAFQMPFARIGDSCCGIRSWMCVSQTL
jgi:hypothetical protein